MQVLAALSIAGLLGLASFGLVVPTAYADVFITASVTPSTVVSGATQSWTINFSNGTSATSSIGAIAVNETHDFTISSSGIMCPTGWILHAENLPNGFICSGTGPDVPPGGSESVTFTATTPTVTATTSSMWNLWWQDDVDVEYNAPDVTFTIVPVTTVPTIIVPAGATTTETTTPPTNETITATTTTEIPITTSSSGNGDSFEPTDNETGSVLGAFTETPPVFIGVPGPTITTPAPQVLGAFSLGIPSTGVNDTAQGSLLIAISLTLVAVGIAFTLSAREAN